MIAISMDSRSESTCSILQARSLCDGHFHMSSSDNFADGLLARLKHGSEKALAPAPASGWCAQLNSLLYGHKSNIQQYVHT
jgi:hypothetical protein